MAKVLYLSFTGMTEPLGESQVIQYLLDLVKMNKIYLVSFEKPTAEEKYLNVRSRLSKAGIYWKFFKYSNRYGVSSTLCQMLISFVSLIRLVKKEKIEIIHARSLIAAVVASLLKKILQVKVIFDIRGFAIDEKILEGRLKPNSVLTTFLKWLETKTYQRADHVVTLTHVSKPIIENQYKVLSNRISVIPTCVDSNMFKTVSMQEKKIFREKIGFEENDLIILRTGSLNQGIDFAAELMLFVQLIKLNSKIKLLFLNKNQHSLILAQLEKSKIEKAKFKLISAEINEIYHYMNVADLCVFFVKPSFAKQASAPTKFAEMIACHLHSVTNTNYGDLEYYLKSYPVGLLLNLQNVYSNTQQSSQDVLNYLDKCKKDNINQKIFEDLLNNHFSKQIAITRYQEIYNKVIQI